MNEPEAEVEVPEGTETEAVEASDASDEEVGSSDETEEGQGELQEVEIELDGRKYSIPKELESAFLMQRDYTQKTQSVAEERKALEEHARQLQEQAELNSEDMEDRAVVHMYGQELENFHDIDWDAWYDQDFIEAQKAATRMTQLRDQVSQAEYRISQREGERSAQTQQQVAKRVQETRDFAQKNIKGWSPDVDMKVTEYANSLGFTNDELVENISPKTYQLLYNAWMGTQLSQQKPPEVKPVRKVQGNSSPATTGLSDRLSAKEWMERRSKQIGR